MPLLSLAIIYGHNRNDTCCIACGSSAGDCNCCGDQLFCSFFNQYSLYYVLIGVLIAMCVSSYVRNEKYKKKSTSVLLIMLLAFIGGGVGTLFQWLLLGGPQFENVAQSARLMAGSSNVGYYMCSTLLNVVLNLLDKTASIVIAFMIIRLMPKDTVKEIWFSRWKQNPLTNEEVDDINRQSRK